MTRSPRRSSGVQSLPTTRDRLGRLLLHPVADGYRVVAPDHLAEIAGRGELVVEATVDDQEGLARAIACGRRCG